MSTPADDLRRPRVTVTPPPPVLEHDDVMEGSVVEASPEDSSVVWLDTEELDDSEFLEVLRWNGRLVTPTLPADARLLPKLAVPGFEATRADDPTLPGAEGTLSPKCCLRRWLPVGGGCCEGTFFPCLSKVIFGCSVVSIPPDPDEADRLREDDRLNLEDAVDAENCGCRPLTELDPEAGPPVRPCFSITIELDLRLVQLRYESLFCYGITKTKNHVFLLLS